MEETREQELGSAYNHSEPNLAISRRGLGVSNPLKDEPKIYFRVQAWAKFLKQKNFKPEHKL